MSRIFMEVAESALTSISSSTYSKITMQSDALILDGQCSPYKSHQHKEWVSEGHGVRDLIKMENSRYQVFISGNKADCPFSGDCLTGRLPASIMYQMIEWPMTKPYWLDYQGAVWVAIPDRFSGYDGEGNPLFEGYPEVRFGDEIILSPEPKLENFNEVQIGCTIVKIAKNLDLAQDGDLVAEMPGYQFFVGRPFNQPLTEEQYEQAQKALSPLIVSRIGDEITVQKNTVAPIVEILKRTA